MLALLSLFKKYAKEEPVLWGGSMVGFGSYHYKYDSGQEGDWFITGFSPRKQNFTLYFLAGLNSLATEVKNLGKVTSAKSCVYIKTVDQIDTSALGAIVKKNNELLQKRIKEMKMK